MAFIYLECGGPSSNLRSRVPRSASSSLLLVLVAGHTRARSRFRSLLPLVYHARYTNLSSPALGNCGPPRTPFLRFVVLKRSPLGFVVFRHVFGNREWDFGALTEKWIFCESNFVIIAIYVWLKGILGLRTEDRSWSWEQLIYNFLFLYCLF